jgi:hypothetical protein
MDPGSREINQMVECELIAQAYDGEIRGYGLNGVRRAAEICETMMMMMMMMC